MNEAEALIAIAGERAKERQRGGQGGILLSQPVDQANGNGKATDEVGALLGVSGRTVSDIALVSYCPLPASYTLVCAYVYIEVNARIQEVHGEYIGKYSG